MLSGDGNENDQNKISSLIRKKTTLPGAAQILFLYIAFARLQRETSRNFIVTRFMEQMSYVFLFTFFHCRS